MVAVSGEDVAIITGSEYALSSNPGADWKGFVYTDRPVYRPGHTVEFRAVLRNRSGRKYQVPAGKIVNVKIEDANNKAVLQKPMTLSAFGSVHGEFPRHRHAATDSAANTALRSTEKDLWPSICVQRQAWISS